MRLQRTFVLAAIAFAVMELLYHFLIVAAGFNHPVFGETVLSMSILFGKMSVGMAGWIVLSFVAMLLFLHGKNRWFVLSPFMFVFVRIFVDMATPDCPVAFEDDALQFAFYLAVIALNWKLYSSIRHNVPLLKPSLSS